MSQKEQDEIVGRLFRESVEAKRKAAIVASELKNLTDGLNSLAAELPGLRPNMIDSRHASVGRYINLQAIAELLEQRDDSARKVEEFEKRVRDLNS